MKTNIYSVLAFAFLLVSFAFSLREPLPPAPAAAEDGNAYAVEICKEILPVRSDFKNLGQCVKLFAICGNEGFDPTAGNFPACICEVFELNDLLGLLGFQNYGDCVQNYHRSGL